jgi:hypothetical protein
MQRSNNEKALDANRGFNRFLTFWVARRSLRICAPIKDLFGYLEANDTLNEFLDNLSSASREQAAGAQVLASTN